MRLPPRPKRLLLAGLLVFLAACNFPSAAPTVTPTSLPPTPTPLPPTPTQTPVPPTETPTSIPPSNTPALPSPLPVIPSPALPPTQAAIEPLPGAKFDGTFNGGEITFRTSQNGKQVIPKSVRIRKASCQQGKTVTDLIAFDPPPSFPITDGKFTMSKGDIITITGMFASPKIAQGSLVIHVKAGGTPCTIGPVAWMASAP